MEKQPTQHTPASIARNIGIGVVTPVLAATIIYFLGFNRSSDTDFKKKKEATEKTWAAYVQNKEIFSSVFDQMNKTTDIEATRKNINHEIDVTVANMENIKKEPGADQRVYSTIDITTSQMQDVRSVTNKFLDDMSTFQVTNPTEAEGRAFIEGRAIAFKKDVSDIRQRDSIRLATFYEGLNKDYSVTLPKH